MVWGCLIAQPRWACHIFCTHELCEERGQLNWRNCAAFDTPPGVRSCCDGMCRCKTSICPCERQHGAHSIVLTYQVAERCMIYLTLTRAKLLAQPVPTTLWMNNNHPKCAFSSCGTCYVGVRLYYWYCRVPCFMVGAALCARNIPLLRRPKRQLFGIPADTGIIEAISYWNCSVRTAVCSNVQHPREVTLSTATAVHYCNY